MLYMVIDHFKSGAAPEVYRRARDHGRALLAPAPEDAQVQGAADAAGGYHP
jgi:hypothetical protein